MLSDLAYELREACALSQIEDVRGILLSTHHFTNEELTEAVACAAKNDNIEILEMLWAAGWNVRAYTAQAGIFGTMKSSAHENSVRWLLQHGANPNIPQVGGVLPVITAAFYAPLSVLALLLENGTVLKGTGALSAAATSLQPDRIARIDLVLKHGAYVNEMTVCLPWHMYGLRRAYCGTALHAACRWGFEDCEQHLLLHGADAEALDSHGRKPVELKRQTLGLSYRGWSSAYVSRDAKTRFKAKRIENLTQNPEEGKAEKKDQLDQDA